MYILLHFNSLPLSWAPMHPTISHLSQKRNESQKLHAFWVVWAKAWMLKGVMVEWVGIIDREDKMGWTTLCEQAGLEKRGIRCGVKSLSVELDFFFIVTIIEWTCLISENQRVRFIVRIKISEGVFQAITSAMLMSLCSSLLLERSCSTTCSSFHSNNSGCSSTLHSSMSSSLSPNAYAAARRW